MKTLLILLTMLLSSTAMAQFTSHSYGGAFTVTVDSITFDGEAGDVIDARTATWFTGTLSQNDTLTVSNLTEGQQIFIQITNGGTFTLGWSGVSWPSGTVPTLTATANRSDLFSIVKIGGRVRGNVVDNFE